MGTLSRLTGTLALVVGLQALILGSFDTVVQSKQPTLGLGELFQPEATLLSKFKPENNGKPKTTGATGSRFRVDPVLTVDV